MHHTSSLKKKGRKFPPLTIQSIMLQKREKEKQKEKMRRRNNEKKENKERKENKNKTKRRKKEFVEKEKEKRKREDFPALRRSKLDGPSTKVGTCSAIYVWIPKTWSFNKLHKVGDFPTRFTLSLKAI